MVCRCHSSPTNITVIMALKECQLWPHVHEEFMPRQYPPWLLDTSCRRRSQSKYQSGVNMLLSCYQQLRLEFCREWKPLCRLESIFLSLVLCLLSLARNLLLSQLLFKLPTPALASNKFLTSCRKQGGQGNFDRDWLTK